MGVVYSAHDELMGRDVAVKVMMTDLEGEPDIRARFMREAQVSAKLAHRNIVTIFDIGEDNGRLFIVMELLRGDTLDRCLKQRVLARGEGRSDARGLRGAGGGERRRRLPPRREAGQPVRAGRRAVKILDFGIARLASSSMTASGFIVGTPDYMSPEQARGNGGRRAVRHLLGRGGAVSHAGRTEAVRRSGPARRAAQGRVGRAAADRPGDRAGGAFADRVQGARQGSGARFQNFPELSAELSRWRRRYEAETRALAEGVARAMDHF